MGAFNLVDQMTFYGSYHNNKWNQLIHVIFVPAIWWSAVVFACYTGSFLPFKLSGLLGVAVPAIIDNNFVFNLGFFVFAFYALYYLTLGEFIPAITWDTVMFVLFLFANWFYHTYGAKAWIYALMVHVLGWWAQIHVGHMICEGRKPALLDSLFQSIVLAPLFVWFEVLFKLGYKPSLAKKVQESIDKAIADFQSSKKKQ